MANNVCTGAEHVHVIYKSGALTTSSNIECNGCDVSIVRGEDPS